MWWGWEGDEALVVVGPQRAERTGVACYVVCLGWLWDETGQWWRWWRPGVSDSCTQTDMTPHDSHRRHAAATTGIHTSTPTPKPERAGRHATHKEQDGGQAAFLHIPDEEGVGHVVVAAEEEAPVAAPVQEADAEPVFLWCVCVCVLFFLFLGVGKED